MARPYERAQVLETARYTLRQATADGNYSSFNMGAGEDVLIDLLHLLDTTPDESLIVIEEVELGLHPEAVRKLAACLLDLTWQKKLQVIVSSHSEDFIDAVPRRARKLVQRMGRDHLVVDKPTTRLAVGDLSGRT